MRLSGKIIKEENEKVKRLYTILKVFFFLEEND